MMYEKEYFVESEVVKREFRDKSENVGLNSSWKLSVVDQLRGLHNKVEVFESDERGSGNVGSSGVREEFVDLREKLNAKKRSELNDRGDGDCENVVQCRGREIDSRQNFVDLREKLGGLAQKGKLAEEKITMGNCVKNYVIKLYAELELKEKRLKEGFENLKSEEKLISDARQVLALKEEEIKEKSELLESKHKDMAEYWKVLEAIKKELDEGCKVLEAKQKDVGEVWKALEAKEKEMDKHRGLIEIAEKESQSKLNKRYNKLHGRERKVNESERVLELKEKNLLERLESKERQLEEHWVALKSKEAVWVERLESKEKELEERCRVITLNEDRSLSDVCWVVDWKLRQMNKRFDVMEMEEKRKRKYNLEGELRSKQIGYSNDGLKLKDKQVGVCGVGDQCQEQGTQVELMDTQVNEYIGTQGSIEKQINESSNQLEGSDKRLELRAKHIHVESQGFSENHINESSDHSELKESELNGKTLALKVEHVDKEPQGLIEKQINKVVDKVSSKEKEESGETKEAPISKRVEEYIGDVTRELKELTKTDVIDHHGKMESNEKPLGNCDKLLAVPSSYSEEDSIRHNAAMNGKALLTYLNERADKHESMGEEIKSILRSLDDPAKLVLDAINGFYSQVLNQDDAVASEFSVVRSSCLLLLEQLMRIKPLISKNSKLEAETIAAKWMSNMKLEGMSDILVLGFLLLVGTYNLLASFSWKTLEGLCAKVDHHKMAPELRQRLCVAQRPSGEHLNECYYVFVQELLLLVDTDLKQPEKEPPPSEVHDVVCNTADSSSPVKVDSENHMKQPEREPPPSEVHDVVCNTVDSSSPVTIDSEIHMLCKNMDVHGVMSYMIQSAKEKNMLHDKIFDALTCASDPAKLVLNITQTFIETKEDEVNSYVIKVCCIYLLELLMKLSPSISPDLEQDARDFAVVWKEKLYCGTKVAINLYGFLHFVAAFKLTKLYKEIQLMSLFKACYPVAKLYPPEKNAGLCCALGVKDKLPGFVQLLIKREMYISAVKCVSLLKMEDFPPVPLLEAYLESVKRKVDDKLKTLSSEGKIDGGVVELAHLRGALKSITSLNLPFTFPTESLSSRIKQLEEAKRLTAKSSKKRGANVNKTPDEQSQKRLRMDSDVTPCQ